jgi:hypothetical protein
MGAPRRAGGPPAAPVVFRVAAGPRLGAGHAVRAVRLAQALGVVPLVSVRGDARGALDLSRLGATRVEGGARVVLARFAPRVLVVDDPDPRRGAAWVRAARRVGIATVSLHDLGLGSREADTLVDGSPVRTGAPYPPGRSFVGPRFAVVDPAVSEPARRPGPRGKRVLVALGGGARRHVAARLARCIRRMSRCPVVVAGGLAAAEHREDGVAWLGPQPSLVPWLQDATVAVVAGGVTLYEACALGVPVVAVAVVAAQRPTVRAFARRGAVRDGGLLTSRGRSDRFARVARVVARLLAAPQARRALARRAKALVDGGGTHRVAGLIAQALQRPRNGRGGVAALGGAS